FGGGNDFGDKGGGGEIDLPGGDLFNFESLASFEDSSIQEFGSPADFKPVFDVFDDIDSEGCKP
ncbi:MAG TPA: hypothetical protein DD452_02020, partial [Nitrospina sp.]|nr:hypothetical protein [Nitrospina sp.]